MNPIIPPALADHLQQCLEYQSLTLVTSVLDTPANWLLARFLAIALQNDRTKSPTSALQATSTSESRKVIFVSLWRSFDLWSELTGKLGLNLQDAISSNRLCYIDGLSLAAAKSPGTIALNTLSTKDLDQAISYAFQHLLQHDSSATIVVLLDGLDFLLAVDSLTSHVDVQHLLLDLQTRSQSVVTTCAADSALLHKTDASATPLELEHTNLVRSLAHQARWLFQLRPLETGQSKEVTGSIRASKGGAWEALDGVSNVDESEWLFHHRGPGTIRIWGRGEA